MSRARNCCGRTRVCSGPCRRCRDVDQLDGRAGKTGLRQRVLQIRFDLQYQQQHAGRLRFRFRHNVRCRATLLRIRFAQRANRLRQQDPVARHAAEVGGCDQMALLQQVGHGVKQPLMLAEFVPQHVADLLRLQPEAEHPLFLFPAAGLDVPRDEDRTTEAERQPEQPAAATP
jgi:hypothetical protein